MNNLKKKIHIGTPEEAIDSSNTFADIVGITIKFSQHSTFINSDGSLGLVIIDFYVEVKQ